MIHKFSMSCISMMLSSLPFLSAGCASINAEAQLGDGYKFQMESIGSKAQVYSQCLTPEQIKAFFPGHTPPGAPQASCYAVFLITSSNSVIADSMQEFIESKNEFDEILAEILKAKNVLEASKRISTVRPQKPLAADAQSTTSVGKAAASAIASDALVKQPEEIQSRAEAVGKQLTEPQKATLVENLKEIKSETPVEKVKEGVNAAIETLQAK